MALRDRLPFGLPFADDPGRKGNGQPAPLDSMLGHTAPAPTPEQMPMPTVGAVPLGQSGRANFWGLPQPDELNQQLVGPQGLRRLNEMYRTDAHVRRLVLAAWSPIVAGTWTLEPYGGEDATDLDREIAKDIWWLLSEWMSPNFEEHLHQIGPLLIRSGFLACEQVGWTSVKRGTRTLLCPRKLDLRLPSSVWRWWQDDFGELTHIGQILPNRADVIIPATELVYYRLGAEGDNWQGTSLLRHAWKHWYLKDKLERIDAIGQERKAVGVPVVYPPKGASPQVKGQLERILANLHMSEVAYVMMPGPKAGSQGSTGVPEEEWLLDVIKFDSSSGEGIHTSIDYHQTAIAASFLTDFLELGHHQVGARATAEVQEDPFLTAINGALLPPVVPPLNRFIDRIRRINWDGADGSPTLKLTLHDEASLSEIAAYVTPLVQVGAMQVDPELEDYLRDRGGMPPANADLRAKREAAQQAGLDAAGDLASKGEEPGAEPPPPNADPAKPLADAGKTAPTRSTGSGKQESTQLDAGGRQTVAVDFDGVLHPKGENAAAELTAPPIPGAAAGLIRLGKKYDVVIFTARTDLAPVRAYLQKHAMGAFAHSVTNRKPPAVAYVDDRAVPFSNWTGVEKEVAKQLDQAAAAIKGAGIVVHAADTGRVLTIQRTPDDSDPAGVFARFEFPGGGVGDDAAAGDSSAWQTAVRELEEETGAPLPSSAQRLGAFFSPDGAYQCFVVGIPNETDLELGHGDKAETANVAWQHPDSLEGGTMSDRAQQLLPGLRGVLVSKQLDGFAPLSGGTTGADGLQMVDQVDGKACTCTDGKVDPDCPVHGSKKLDAPEPTAKWFERLLSQDQLAQAFDGARDHIQAACSPPALTLARQLAHQAANGTPMTASEPPPGLVDALARHYADLYQLGHETVSLELAKQRAALGKQLDDPVAPDAAAAGLGRLDRARKRGEHSARNILNAVQQRLGRDQITGLKEAAALQAAAEQAATAQLRVEALANTGLSINDGRNDVGSTSSDVVGAYYTSVLDQRTCMICEAADTGDLLSPEAAVSLGPPNPDCEGGDYCRCTLVWVLSSDPAALAAVA